VVTEKLLTVRAVPCYNFTDENGVQKKVTAIIVPICVTRTLNKTTVAYACSMALSCYCRECRYSKGHSRSYSDYDNHDYECGVVDETRTRY
jgi:ribose 5-phosphate isomerase